MKERIRIMKKIKKALAAALALAMIAACDAAQAQRILNGVGSRLTGRGAQSDRFRLFRHARYDGRDTRASGRRANDRATSRENSP